MMVLEVFEGWTPKKIIILQSGKRPQKCKLLFGELRPQLIHHDSYILIDAVSPSGVMVVYDLANCRESEHADYAAVFNKDNYVVVYNEETLGIPVHQGSLSPDGRELAIATILEDNEPFSIVVFDLATKEYRFIDYGLSPSFSPDGEWVAYSGITEGIYIARRDGSENQKLVNYENPEFGGGGWFTQMDWPPKPVWSPDGNWLVYHKCELEGTERSCNRLGYYVIYKVNVHTGEEVKIIEGGLNPYWRP
jgi:hypothetical protein